MRSGPHPHLCSWLAALLLLAAPASPADPTRSGLAGPRPGPTLHGELRLSLADSIAMGLENNLGVEIQRHSPLIANEDAGIAWGAYDPALGGEFGYSDDRAPNSFQLAGVSESQQERLTGIGGVRGLVPWLNTQVAVQLETARLETNSGVQALSPEYRTRLTVVARQPLLRGLIWSEPWTRVIQARTAYASSLEDFRRVVMDTVQLIENAYWTLIADDERVRVAEKSLETARALLDQVNTQYEVGVVSKVEIAEAEAGVASREFELITAQNRYENAMDGLIDLVLGTHLTPESRIEIEPTDRPDEFVPYDIDVQQAADIAFDHRPEIAVADKQIELQTIGLKHAKNRRLPFVDVEGRWGQEGLAGQANPNLAFGAPNPAFFGDWGDSFDPLADSYGVRGIVTIPLGAIDGRHSVSKAQLELRRARVQRRRVEQDIVLQVRRASRNLMSAQEGIEAADRQRAAASEQLRAERIRLEYGESTPFDVLQREEDLVSAEQGYIAAFQVYRTSVTGLDRAQGTILRNRNISIEEVSRLR